jgi:hypothetical protein
VKQKRKEGAPAHGATRKKTNAAMAVSVREQTFRFGTRKLGVQKILGCLEAGTVRDHGEGSVARGCQEEKSCWD